MRLFIASPDVVFDCAKMAGLSAAWDDVSIAPMKSPIGKRLPMQPVAVSEGLTGYVCQESGGHYIPANFYWRWLSRQADRLPRLPLPAGAPGEEEPFAPARLCPETGTIMTRYQVGHGFRFSIDRSITGGVWLDAGEWEALRERNFHDELHLVFTAPWQKAVLTEQARAAYKAMLLERLGPALLEKLTSLKHELESSPHQALAIAFLTSEDVFSS